MEKIYEKPELKKVVLMANERVAADCEDVGSLPPDPICGETANVVPENDEPS